MQPPPCLRGSLQPISFHPGSDSNWPIHYDSTDLHDSLLWLVMVGNGRMFILSVHWGKIVQLLWSTLVCVCANRVCPDRILSTNDGYHKLPVRQGDEVRCPKHNASATDCG